MNIFSKNGNGRRRSQFYSTYSNRPGLNDESSNRESSRNLSSALSSNSIKSAKVSCNKTSSSQGEEAKSSISSSSKSLESGSREFENIQRIQRMRQTQKKSHGIEKMQRLSVYKTFNANFRNLKAIRFKAYDGNRRKSQANPVLLFNQPKASELRLRSKYSKSSMKERSKNSSRLTQPKQSSNKSTKKHISGLSILGQNASVVRNRKKQIAALYKSTTE